VIHQRDNWHGSYAIIDYDELSYSAYLNSLMHGRPRRNDPYTSDREKDAENLFSIQFLPPYVLAIIARASRVSASTVFILLMPLMAFLSSLAIFWFFYSVIGNAKAASVFMLIVLLCGGLVSQSGFKFGVAYSAFAFLRRYVPAVPFPLFFVFCLCSWRAFNLRFKRAKLWALFAGLVFSFLVFSYFYLWTAAAAWFFSLTMLWLIARPDERSHVFAVVAILLGISVPALSLYFYLLSRRTQTTDIAQALTYTHAPDLFRPIEIMGFLTLGWLIWGVLRRSINFRSPLAVLTASFAIAPMVVFNQQIVTGITLQPFHYEQFIINHVVLVGLVLAYQMLGQHIKIRLFLWVVFAVGIGLATGLKEAHGNLSLNVRRDEAKPVFERLDSLVVHSDTDAIALFNNSLLAASAPTCSSVAQLWAPNLYTYSYTSRTEEIERLHLYLYYLGVDPLGLETDLRQNIQLQAAVFGLHRVNSLLSPQFTPISDDEMHEAVAAYSAFIKGLSLEQVSRWPVSYVVMIDQEGYNLSNLDRWYFRDSGEVVGGCVLYRVRLKREAKG